MPACFINTCNNNKSSDNSTLALGFHPPSIKMRPNELLLSSITTTTASPPHSQLNNTNSASLRRSLSSIDMSSSSPPSNTSPSPSPMKKIASFNDHLNELVVVDNNNFNKKDEEPSSKGAFDDIWKSINQKQQQQGSTNYIPPYVHPLCKRSTSTLSSKSLEICTESLGSETGSDGFSFTDSPTNKVVVVTEPEEEQLVVLLQSPVDDDNDEMMKKNVVVDQPKPKVVAPPSSSSSSSSSAGSRKVIVGGPRCFPPPLPSLATRGNYGSNLHVTMRSHRQDGRLVLEAVSVPAPNCFHAERMDGRLLLTFQGHDDHDGVNEEEEEVGDLNQIEEVTQGGLTSEIPNDPMMNVNYGGHKFMGLTKTRPSGHHHNNNNITTTGTAKDEVAKPPLPPRPPSKFIPATAAAAASFNYNAYEYYWRRNSNGGNTTTNTTTVHHQSTYLDTSSPGGGGKRAPPPTLSPKTMRGINDMFVELAAAHHNLHHHNTTKELLLSSDYGAQVYRLHRHNTNNNNNLKQLKLHQLPAPPTSSPYVAACRLPLLMWDPPCIATS